MTLLSMSHIRPICNTIGMEAIGPPPSPPPLICRGNWVDNKGISSEYNSIITAKTLTFMACSLLLTNFV